MFAGFAEALKTAVYAWYNMGVCFFYKKLMVRRGFYGHCIKDQRGT